MSPEPLRQALRRALLTAMKARDEVAVPALRATLAAIDNAESVAHPAAANAGALEQSPVGVGATEVARRTLSEAEVADIVRAEMADLEAAARDYDRAAQPDRATALRNRAAMLATHLSD
jgi:uncharacterized protein YqeY